MILRRLPDSRFSEVLREWEGATTVLLGGGPSLSLQQIQRVHDAHARGQVKCIAINDSYLLAPWADVHYAADSHWHKWHSEGIEKPALGLSASQVSRLWASFTGQKCTIQNTGANIEDTAVHVLRNKHFPHNGNGLSLDPEALVTGRHSGFQALNLAILAGAAVVILLGYDAKEPEAKTPSTHWHGGHPRPTPVLAYPEYRRSFSAAENAIRDAGVRVINCNPRSGIDSFEKCELEEAL